MCCRPDEIFAATLALPGAAVQVAWHDGMQERNTLRGNFYRFIFSDSGRG